jgi:hypothetical protein
MPGPELLLFLAAQLLLTALPGIAAVLLGVRLGVREVPVLLALGLTMSGIVAMLAFWAFYAAPLAGESFAYLALFGSLILIGWSLQGGRLDRALLRRLATPLTLWILGSVFLVFFGFLHGGVESPLATAATRFSHQLPSDNDIPQFFADWFFNNGHDGTPPVFPGEWLSSDRPPLQMGYVLSQRPFGWDNTALRYQLIGVVLQQLWIVGLWALLLAARVGRVTRGLTMVTVLVSSVAIVNGFFVWPKLLPAAMLLAAAALVMTPLWSELRRSLAGAALVGTLFGLAMLGHGSSVFGIVPLALIAAFRGFPGWRWVGVCLLIGLTLLTPWSAYQSYGDPPGNRLSKWMLGGAIEIDDRGTIETILDSYGEDGIGGAIDNKFDNFVTMIGGEPTMRSMGNAIDAAGSGEAASFLREVRAPLFFYLLPSLGLLLIAPFAMVVARTRGRMNSSEWRLALNCFAVFAIGAVCWGLLLFGGSLASTVIHQGSYLLPVLGLCGAVVGLRATFPRFAVPFVGVAALLTLALYVPALDSMPGTGYSIFAATIAAAGLVGFCAVGFEPVVRSPKGRLSEPSQREHRRLLSGD